MSGSVAVNVMVMVVAICKEVMENDWLQERIDELYLLEQRATERLGRLEVHYENHVAGLKSQAATVQSVVATQRDALSTLTAKLSAVEAWYRRILRVGSFLGGFVVLSVLGLFLGWQHVMTVSATNQKTTAAIHWEMAHLPYVAVRKGKLYVRVVPDTMVSALHDDDGKSLSGPYAQVYLLGERP